MTMIFDRDFDLELALEEHQARRAARARHTPEELEAAIEAARAEAYADGRCAGYAEGQADAAEAENARRVAALEVFGQQLPAMVADNKSHRAALETQVLDFALVVCEQVFPELLRHRAHDRVLAQVRRALNVGLGSVSLRVALSSGALPLLQDDLGAEIVRLGLEGRVELRADPILADGDARVDWDSGFLEYSFSTICDRLLCTLREARSAIPLPLSEH